LILLRLFHENLFDKRYYPITGRLLRPGDCVVLFR